MPDEVYQRLREFLDGLPGGFPATESGVEIKLLKRYFTPEEAELVMRLQPYPEPVPAIAARLGMDEAEAAEALESLARSGGIYRLRLGDQPPMYMAMQFLIGIYEFHLKAMDRELAELLEEYLPHLSRFWGTMRTKQQRVVPVGASIDTATAVATYDHVRETGAGAGPHRRGRLHLPQGARAAGQGVRPSHGELPHLQLRRPVLHRERHRPADIGG